MGSSPSAPASAPRHRCGLSSGRLTLSFLRESAAGDLTWIVEGADTLASAWQPLAQRAAAVSTWTILVSGASVVENNDHVVFTDAVSLADHPRRFLRLRVEQTP